MSEDEGAPSSRAEEVQLFAGDGGPMTDGHGASCVNKSAGISSGRMLFVTPTAEAIFRETSKFE